MRPGLGFGGGCLPKDFHGFITRADELDAGEAVGMLHRVAVGHRCSGTRDHRTGRPPPPDPAAASSDGE
ncbi:hypothetical protein [Streptomyces atratus]|uniref:hypothetical protein n=1 Tax=Streptomyces atratus TaxID=1893 RepID=UPI00365CB2B3